MKNGVVMIVRPCSALQQWRHCHSASHLTLSTHILSQPVLPLHRNLRHQKIHCHLNIPPLVLIPKHTNLIKHFHSKYISILSSALRPFTPRGLCPLGFATNSGYAKLFYPMRTTWSANHILIDMAT